MQSPSTLTPPRRPPEEAVGEAGAAATHPGRRVPRTPPTLPTPPATRQLAPAVFAAILVATDVLALAGAHLLTFWETKPLPTIRHQF